MWFQQAASFRYSSLAINEEENEKFPIHIVNKVRSPYTMIQENFDQRDPDVVTHLLSLIEK
jgi:hypothetical protein